MNASLTTLGEHEARYETDIVAVDSEIIHLSGIPPLPLGSPVRISQGQNLWLCEIVESGSGGATVAKVVHALHGITELTRLAEQFLGKQRAGTATIS